MVWLCKIKIWWKSKTFLRGYSRFIVQVKTDDNYKDIAEDVEKRSDTSNFEIDRRLPKEKNKKIIGLMKDELDLQIMKECCMLH